MAISNEEMHLEEAYLKTTGDLITKQISDIGSNLYQEESKVNEFKKYLWDNKAGMDSVEVSAAILDNDLEVELLTMRGKYLRKLLRVEDSPYFGRIDFNGEEIYIGLTYVNDENKHYVYDWRSPIANMFYDSGVGHASYVAPKGIIEGEITKKRQYKIENKKLIRVFDNNLNVDDEMLQEVLSSESSDKMKNIVNTIQQEQNAIIRDVKHKNLIVQGIAGSGKTSVALHRIAFLLYKIKNLKSNDILILSPNNVFSEYISNVLPELGEENTANTTWSEFAKSYIKEYKKVESFTNFVERHYKDNNTDNKLIELKLSDKFKDIMDKYINKILSNALFSGSIEGRYKDFDSDELNYLLKVRYSNLTLSDRITKISEVIAKENDNGKYSKRYIGKLYEILNIKKDYREVYRNLFKDEDFIKEYGEFDTSFIDQDVLNYEDSLNYIYIKGLLEGFPYNGILKQVIVDEAQDYTPLQYTILKEIFKNASFTILGDINQTINPYYKYDSLRILENILNKNVIYLELLKTYRSSKEIIEYTNKILHLNFVSAIRDNNNIPVTIKEETNLYEQLKYDLNELINNYKSVAIITKNDIEAKKIYNLLKKDYNINLLESNSKEFNRDLVVVPAYVSKGLEFDSVIVYTDINNKFTEKEKFLFYVACTRCQHKLIVYNN
ncbi:MAG: AAA family ATPase [Bacilli bacterium]|nr:AAA family ATPase [Bacilli bacterium]